MSRGGVRAVCTEEGAVAMVRLVARMQQVDDHSGRFTACAREMLIAALLLVYFLAEMRVQWSA
jgi:hypothetical protein